MVEIASRANSIMGLGYKPKATVPTMEITAADKGPTLGFIGDCSEALFKNIVFTTRR